MHETGIATTMAVIMLDFKILEPPESIRSHVECFRVSTYGQNGAVALKVCPTGHPEIVFQHRSGKSAIESIRVESGRVVTPPRLFVHGQVTEVAVMSFQGPFSTIQAVLKPFGLQSLFGLNAAEHADSSTTLDALFPESRAARELEHRLVDAGSEDARIEILSKFLEELAASEHRRDLLVEESLKFIERQIASITVRSLLKHVGLSERRYERRFSRAVGIPPQLYLRVRRINEAFRLMDTGGFRKLSDVAYALSFYDQSHFIREVRTFSGITPKSISQRVIDFHNDVVASSYLYG